MQTLKKMQFELTYRFFGGKKATEEFIGWVCHELFEDDDGKQCPRTILILGMPSQMLPALCGTSQTH